MAQHDYNIANQSGQAFRADLNNALAAIVSTNSGASAPSTTYAYQYWVDTSTSPATLKQRNSSNNAWISIGLLDTANVQAGLGSIVNADVNANAGIVASKLSFTQSGTGAAARTIDSRLKDVVSVKDFGAKGDGTTDDTAACQAAVNYVVSRGGGQVFFPFGTYLLNGTAGLDGIKHGIHVPYTSPGIQGASTSVDLIGEGRDTILKAGSASMYVIRYSSSLGCVRDLQILGDGTTLGGLALVGAHTTNDTGPAEITHNDFTRLFILYCVNGILLRCPANSASGIYYNNFSDIYIVYNQTAVAGQRGRGIYLQGGGPGSNNRNTFRSITCKRVNTGIEIQDGDTNTFFACMFEDVGAGSTLPNNPGASIIIGSGAGFVLTESNRFFGCTDESATRSVVNANSYSEFYGCSLGVGGTNVFTAQPRTWLGGYDASAVPTIVPGLRRDANTTSFQSFDVTTLTAATATATTQNITTALEISRKLNPASSAVSVNIDLGGTTNGTGPGGSGLTHAYAHPYDGAAVYLAIGSAISATTGQMMRVSFVIETASGTFIEQNVVNYTATTTGSFVFARSGDDINFTFNVATNNGSVANVRRNFIRVA